VAVEPDQPDMARQERFESIPDLIGMPPISDDDGIRRQFHELPRIQDLASAPPAADGATVVAYSDHADFGPGQGMKDKF